MISSIFRRQRVYLITRFHPYLSFMTFDCIDHINDHKGNEYGMPAMMRDAPYAGAIRLAVMGDFFTEQA